MLNPTPAAMIEIADMTMAEVVAEIDTIQAVIDAHFDGGPWLTAEQVARAPHLNDRLRIENGRDPIQDWGDVDVVHAHNVAKWDADTEARINGCDICVESSVAVEEIGPREVAWTSPDTGNDLMICKGCAESV